MNSAGRSVSYRAFQITEQETFPLGWGVRSVRSGMGEGEADTDRAVDSVNLSSHGNTGSLAFLCPVKCVPSRECYHFLPWVFCRGVKTRAPSSYLPVEVLFGELVSWLNKSHKQRQKLGDRF